VDQGEKLSRVPLHSIRNQNSDIKALDNNTRWSFDVNIGDTAAGQYFDFNVGTNA
jgi:hypothetical protein